jgi:hypothetical protein
MLRAQFIGPDRKTESGTGGASRLTIHQRETLHPGGDRFQFVSKQYWYS